MTPEQKHSLEARGLWTPSLPPWLVTERDAMDRQRFDDFIASEQGQAFILDQIAAAVLRVRGSETPGAGVEG